MKLILLIALVALACCVGGSPTSPVRTEGCSFWCKNPKGQVYCCQEGVNTDPVHTHLGSCPTFREVCPAHAQSFDEGASGARRPPSQVCAQDGQCRKTEKCCYDSCLEHHACKPIGVRTG